MQDDQLYTGDELTQEELNGTPTTETGGTMGGGDTAPDTFGEQIEGSGAEGSDEDIPTTSDAESDKDDEQVYSE